MLTKKNLGIAGLVVLVLALVFGAVYGKSQS
jgi:hypothetical protein